MIYMAQFEHAPTPGSHWLDGKQPAVSAASRQNTLSAQALHWSRMHLVQLAQEIETTKIDLSDKDEQLGIAIEAMRRVLGK
jgi:hypothetical protein